MGELLQAVLNERIPIREGDKICKVSRAEATVRALMQKALRGDAKAFVTLIALTQRSGEFEKEPMKFDVIERVIVDPKEGSGSS